MCEVIHIYVGKNQPAPCFATIGAAIEYAGRIILRCPPPILPPMRRFLPSSSISLPVCIGKSWCWNVLM